ncbi:MAG: hypothetical protein GY856_08980 [bacterium]|nr:hypothetical protein [bacterium]
MNRYLRGSVLMWLLAAGGLSAAGPDFGPRPLSPAERQAVALAVSYFTGGAASWWDRLAADAPLRELGREAALAEIRARVGPAERAIWRLWTPARRHGAGVAVFTIDYPSGLDETLLLEIVERDGGKIARIRSRVDPVEGAQSPLGALGPLREALAEGRSHDLERLLQALPDHGPVAEVGRLWEAQYRLDHLDLPRTAALLQQVAKSRSGPPLPLAALLRARLGHARGDSLEMAVAYDLALTDGIDHEGLRLESLETQALLGFVDETGYRRLAEMGSRSAAVYYTMSENAVIYKEPGAEEHFRTAWQLEPLERVDVFDHPVFARISSTPEMAALLELNSAAEPRVAPPAVDRRPLRFPESAQLLLTGNSLRVILDRGHIEIPGGGVLAPEGTVVDDAAAGRRHREREVLAELEAMIEAARSPAALANLALRRRMETAAFALARRRRWDDLLRLTDGIAERATQAGPLLGIARAAALRGTGRLTEAVHLLVELAQNARDAQRSDVWFLHQLAELCVEEGKLDLALQLLRRAHPNSSRERSVTCIRQIELDRDLAKSNKRLESRHFTVRYSPSVIEEQVERVSALLEDERERLKVWIPLKTEGRVDVSLFSWGEYRSAYSLSLGFFDGTMRVPYFGTDDFQIMLTGTLTHELTHAMIMEYAGEGVPPWFHEGLAELTEKERGTAYPDPPDPTLVLALPVIDAVIDSYRHAEITGLAYRDAAWTVYFIQSQYGIDGIRRSLQLFAAGKDTEAVLSEAFGLSVADFHRARRVWCLNEAPRLIEKKKAVAEEIKEARRAEKARADAIRAAEEAKARGQEKALPKVGGRTPDLARTKEKLARKKEELARKKEELAHLADEISAWHRDYNAKTRPVKKSLRVLYGILRGREQGAARLGPTCRQLSEELEVLLSDRQVFECPVGDAVHPLKEAYRYFKDAATACIRGQSGVMQAALDNAEHSLRVAAALLELIGLAP